MFDETTILLSRYNDIMYAVESEYIAYTDNQLRWNIFVIFSEDNKLYYNEWEVINTMKIPETIDYVLITSAHINDIL
jgi:hypothetical protein